MRSEPKVDKYRDYIGFTEADVALAVEDGCDLFVAFQKGDFLVSMASGPQNPMWVERTFGPPARVSFRELETKQSTENVVFTNILGEFVLYTVPGQTPHKLFGSQPPPNIVPNSQVSFTRARRFLEDCVANHAQCRDFNLKHMPTRVLEVYSASDTDTPDSPMPFRVRLVSNPAPRAYATLSYCWGGDQPGKTLKRRLASYSRDIPLDALPLTIIDVLTVTHGVALEYLWVDALCIIQDSNEDKMAEISNMHRTYRGSVLTIAACVAGTSLDGFLRPRIHDRGYVLNARLDSSNNNSSDEIRQVIGIPVRSRLDETIPPLYTRAWTFQEGQLFTRVLAYGNRGMVYYYLESRHCDGGHEQPIYDTWLTKDAIGAGFRYLDHGNQSLSKIVHPCAWGSVLEAYTSRQLTVGDDKLLVVMAIAEEYRRTKPVTEYLTGLWREDFLF
ncbi:uncharacterized protein QC763_0087530 [Podospora pseudopauciseta]|uniref:Heterokaryon incompatibility domain-containing protein n=1 Tax=Podospora pseudopauciseta TaxID=2093780 RepID=A0ABR0H9M4_9PEZI|nr:hypothetical protein QC763_0087530 [Podospora pseudopauciseta]